MNSLNLMTKKLQSKEFVPMISSVEGQCANHFTMKSGVIAIIFKWTGLCINGVFPKWIFRESDKSLKHEFESIKSSCFSHVSCWCCGVENSSHSTVKTDIFSKFRKIFRGNSIAFVEFSEFIDSSS